jgi:hypothetical protein
VCYPELRQRMLDLIDEDLERWHSDPLTSEFILTDWIRVNISVRKGASVLRVFGCEKWNVGHREAASALLRIRDAVEAGYADDSLAEFF